MTGQIENNWKKLPLICLVFFLNRSIKIIKLDRYYVIFLRFLRITLGVPFKQFKIIRYDRRQTYAN